MSERKREATPLNKRGDLRIPATSEELAKAVMRPKRRDESDKTEEDSNG